MAVTERVRPLRHQSGRRSRRSVRAAPRFCGTRPRTSPSAETGKLNRWIVGANSARDAGIRTRSRRFSLFHEAHRVSSECCIGRGYARLPGTPRLDRVSVLASPTRTRTRTPSHPVRVSATLSLSDSSSAPVRRRPSDCRTASAPSPFGSSPSVSASLSRARRTVQRLASCASPGYPHRP